jgi:hypothetical protein
MTDDKTVLPEPAEDVPAGASPSDGTTAGTTPADATPAAVTTSGMTPTATPADTAFTDDTDDTDDTEDTEGTDGAPTAAASATSNVTAEEPDASFLPGTAARDSDTPTSASPPAKPNPFVAAFTAIDPNRFGRAAIIALIAFAVAWALGLLTTAIALAGANSPTTDWAWIFEAPGQLIAASVAGTLSASTSFLGVTVSIGILWLPLLFTAVLAGVVVVLARRDEAVRATTRTTRWILSGAVGLVLAIISVLIAAVVPLSVSTGSASTTELGAGAAHLSLSGASVTGLLGALVLGTLASFLARSSLSRSGAGRVRRVPVAGGLLVSVRSAVTAIVLYLVIAGVLLVVIEVIVILARSGVAALASIGLWLPTAVVDGLAAINLSPIGITGSLNGLFSLGGAPTSIWLPTTLPAWATILVILLDVVLIAFIGFALAARRRQNPSTPALDWASTVIGFAAVGAVISIVGSIAVWSRIDTSGLGDSLKNLLGATSGDGGASAIGALGSQQLSIGPAAWTFILFAIVGGLIQVARVWASPTLLRLLPAAFTGFIGLTLDRFAGPTARPASQPAVPSDGGAPSDSAIASDPTDAHDASAAVGPNDTLVLPGAAPLDSSTNETVPLQAVPSAAPRAPMDPAQRRRVILVSSIVGGVIVLVIIAAVALSIVTQTLFSPKHEAEKYLQSLVAKDASTALKVGHVSAGDASNALLTNAALKATTNAVTGYTVHSTTSASDDAIVVAQVKQGTATTTQTLTLHRTGSTFLFFPTWELRPVSLSTLNVAVSAGITSLKINGQTIAVPASAQADGAAQFAVFPGKYRVGLAGATKYLAAATVTADIAASAGSEGSVQLELAPTQAFRDALTTQIGTLLTSCVSQKVLEPKGCPFYYFGFGDITKVKWTINTVPQLSLDPAGDGTWNVTSEQPGDASVTFDESYFGTTHETGDSSFYVNGTADLSSGEPVFSVTSTF